RRLPAEEHRSAAPDPPGPRARALGPRKRGAVRLRRVGRGEDQRLRLLAVSLTKLAQPLDGAAERELRATETFDEVAATAEPERLERPQLAVDRGVAARDAFRADAFAGDDPVALEQELRERAPVGVARKEPRGRRPASLRRGGLARAAPWEAARPL